MKKTYHSSSSDSSSEEESVISINITHILKGVWNNSPAQYREECIQMKLWNLTRYQRTSLPAGQKWKRLNIVAAVIVHLMNKVENLLIHFKSTLDYIFT